MLSMIFTDRLPHAAVESGEHADGTASDDDDVGQIGMGLLGHHTAPPG